jgi:murein DD-endopeptidase MepM/ murein hydrolase activator NlpD
VRTAHCSEFCLSESVRRQQILRALRRRRRFAQLAVLAAVVVAAPAVWHRFRAPRPHSISYVWTEIAPETPQRPETPTLKPNWPPTDDDWMFAFAAVRWVYPLPGPIRRMPTVDDRIFGPEAPKGRRPFCRADGHCGVDLGGELWGEHVYAVQDGIVDSVRRAGNEEGGGIYVRLAHFGGMVFTHYFHLAALPRHLGRGAHVHAGDVIGLLGDTGVKGAAGRHLYFALSIRPSREFSEVYWDPTPLIEKWPLHVPAHGTVAGFTPPGYSGHP